MSDSLKLLLGIACAAGGAELFVRGAVGIATAARISAGIIGVTVAAFATSGPELAVSLISAAEGQPEIALGDALGANIVNFALILGLALVIASIKSPSDILRRDFPVALLAPAITGLLIYDGELSRLDGFILLAAFGAWLTVTIGHARRERSARRPAAQRHSLWTLAAQTLGGLALLGLAGLLIVSGASGIAAARGIDSFLIGATVVAIGTTVPELATTLLARLRGHHDLSLGNILGSNIINGLLLAALAALIHPIRVPWEQVRIPLLFGALSVAFTFPPRHGHISRLRGVVLLLLYAVYLAVVIGSRADEHAQAPTSIAEIAPR